MTLKKALAAALAGTVLSASVPAFAHDYGRDRRDRDDRYSRFDRYDQRHYRPAPRRTVVVERYRPEPARVVYVRPAPRRDDAAVGLLVVGTVLGAVIGSQIAHGY